MFSFLLQVIFVVLLHHSNCSIVRRRSCPEPELIKNGQRKGSSFSYPDSVEYVCDEGYVLIGESKINCMQNGQWSDDAPDCIVTLCDEPSDPANGKAVYKSIEYGSRLTYECNQGYGLRENVVRICGANSKWSGKKPICEDIKCAVPKDPDNGKAVYESLDVGSELYYECNEGYILSIDFVRECTKDGLWNGEEVLCEVVTCDVPKDPENGKASYESLEFGSELNYECNEGFILSEDFVRECTENGLWNGEEPSCQAITCEVPADPENGKALYESLTYGSELAYECNDGFLLSHDFVRECGGNGNWEGEEPVCEAASCEIPDDPPNGKALYSSVEINSQLKYECNEGFSLSFDIVRECTSDGNWDGETPSCEIILCERPEDPPNGKALYNSVKINSQLKYECNQRYSLSFNITRVCKSDGQWNGEKPSCEIICKYPEVPEGGSVFIRGGIAKVGSIANFKCNHGRKLVGPPFSKCTATGDWSFISPKCLEDRRATPLPTDKNDGDYSDQPNDATTDEPEITTVNCQCTYSVSDGNLQAYNGQELVISGSEVEEGSVLTFHCKEGGIYRLTGRNEIQCLNCKWNSPLFPSCSIPKERNDVFIKVTSHPPSTTGPKGILIVTPGTQLTMSCNTKNRGELPKWKYFDLSSKIRALPKDSIHDDTRRGFSSTFFVSYAVENDSGKYQCEVPSGKSHYIEIKVRDLVCPEIPESDSTFIAYDDGRKTSSKASFWCTKPGAVRVGPANITCMPTGQWSGDPPTCENALCPEITAPDSVVVTYDGNREVFSEASFQCSEPDYEMSGPASIFCLPTLKWSAVPPSCKPTVVCPEIDADESLKVMYDNHRKIYSRVYFWCSFSGTQRNGPDSANCLPTGKWSNNPPRCEDSFCPEMPNDDSVIITYNSGRKLFSSAFFECKISWLQMQGSSVSYRLPGGQWTSNPPTCV